MNWLSVRLTTDEGLRIGVVTELVDERIDAGVREHPHRQGNWLPLFKQDWERREGGE